MKNYKLYLIGAFILISLFWYMVGFLSGQTIMYNQFEESTIKFIESADDLQIDIHLNETLMMDYMIEKVMLIENETNTRSN